jgi:LPS export ABC transporter protein LptC
LWRSFFTGWGLFFTIILIASPFVFRNITWAVLDAVDMDSIQANNLSITNLNLNGTDKNGDSFSISAESALQRFSEPDVIRFIRPAASVARLKDGIKIRDNITADTGRFYKNSQKIILSGNVRVDSSDKTSAATNEMEIDLK